MLVVIALLAGFIGGFWLANSINRSAQQAIGPQPVAAPTAGAITTQQSSEPDLSVEEIKAKIDEADKNPTNFTYQKTLGIALYRYSSIKQAPMLLTESMRILERASSINGKDFEVLVALGNAHFDTGFANKDNASYQTARDIYTKALDIKPSDPDVQTDMAITWFLQEPPAFDKAIAGLQKVSDANPKHIRSLQFMVQTYAKQGKPADAEKALAKIKAIDPASPVIAELTNLISAGQTGSTK